MVKGIDVSHYQNDAGAIDWKKVKAAGYEFVYIKATEALVYVDKYYSKNIADARAAGLVVGSYHFARGNDPVKEADHFLSVVGKMQESDFLVLDWEIEFSNPDYWCRTFLDRCYEKTTVRPFLYTNNDRVLRINWKKTVDGNYALIAARYGDNDATLEPGEEAAHDEFPFVAIQQFSSNVSVPGIVGRVDANVTSMTIEQLKKYGYKSVTAPTPTPTPTPAPSQPVIVGKTRVEPELRDALKYAHNIDIEEFTDPQGQRLMAEHLMLLKNSELQARDRVERVRRVVL